MEYRFFSQQYLGVLFSARRKEVVTEGDVLPGCCAEGRCYQAAIVVIVPKLYEKIKDFFGRAAFSSFLTAVTKGGTYINTLSHFIVVIQI